MDPQAAVLSGALKTNPDAVGNTGPLGVVGPALETFLGKRKINFRDLLYWLLTLFPSLGLSSASTLLVRGLAMAGKQEMQVM